MQNSQAICKRTRSQKSIAMDKLIEANKRARVAARKEFLRKRNEYVDVRMVDVDVDVDDDDDDDDDDDVMDAMEIDKETFLKRNSRLVVENAKKDKNFGCVQEKCKGVVNFDVNGEDSDDSLMVLGEEYNPSNINDVDVNDDDGGGYGGVYGGGGGSKGMQEDKGGDSEESMGLFSSSSSSSEDDESDDNEYMEEVSQVDFSSEEEEEEEYVDDCDDDAKCFVDDGKGHVHGHGHSHGHVHVHDDGEGNDDGHHEDDVGKSIKLGKCSKKKNNSPICKNNARGVTKVDKGVQCDGEMIDREVNLVVEKGVQCDEIMNDDLMLPQLSYLCDIRDDDLVENMVHYDDEIHDRDDSLEEKMDDKLVSQPSPVRITREDDFVEVNSLQPRTIELEKASSSRPYYNNNSVCPNLVSHPCEGNIKNVEDLRSSKVEVKKGEVSMDNEPRSNEVEGQMVHIIMGLPAKRPKDMKMRRKIYCEKKGNVEAEVEPQVPGFSESSIDRKEKKDNMEFMPQDEHKQKIAEQEEEEENAIFDEILEKGEAGLEGVIGVVSNDNDDDNIIRKFRYPEEVVVNEKTIEERELETLFNELDFGLGVCDIGSSETHVEKNDEEVTLCDSAVLQEQLCYEGRHYLIEDEEIGMKCKFCSFVELEIRYVTPSFSDSPFGRSGKISAKFPNDLDSALNGCEFNETINDIGAAQVHGTRGTVWDLIPGTKSKMYEHQIKGFEFIWRNIEGGIKLDQLDKPSKFGLGGCMICHAPGTGKTRLAIIFLQSFVKQYPMAKPIILAPSSILLTWEEEFSGLKIDVPFLNLNSRETSGIDSLRHLRFYRISDKTIRRSKICEWIKGKGILGMSYTLFEKLAGERNKTDENVKRALLKKSGIFVLDEGHTPRNDSSKLWKVLSEVDTKRKIILSGTPFQNNIEELLNTMSLVREDFRDLRVNGQFVDSGWRGGADRRKYGYNKRDEEQRIESLKNKMKPYVDVHKGEILKKALRGLFHSVLDLKPSVLQKTYLLNLERMRNGLQKDHLVSIAAVHPSLLSMTGQVPEFVDMDLLNDLKTDWNAGVKIKFLFELIKLSKGEKVLIFSQFIIPLELIRDLFSSVFGWTDGKEFLYMYGKIGTTVRQSLITKFNNPDSEARVLLASTKACCEGIHLVGASRVVLLDVVWNPSVERQAISRAYRLGQKKDVFVYHLITSGTHEEEKLCRQLAKDRLSELVFRSSDAEGGKELCTLEKVSEDSILEAMIQHKEFKNMFEKIICQPKADKLIESFGPLNL